MPDFFLLLTQTIDDLYKIAEIQNVDIKELLVSNKPEQDTK